MTAPPWSEVALYCPECDMPAWVEWSDALSSTSDAVEHVRLRCFGRHWFDMPAEYLHRDRTTAVERSGIVDSRGDTPIATSSPSSSGTTPAGRDQAPTDNSWKGVSR
jgi:hypothetical protein